MPVNPMAYRLTRKAAEDIGRIYVDSAEKFGLKQADAYHVIYQIEPSGKILILRVRHGHEDWADNVTG